MSSIRVDRVPHKNWAKKEGRNKLTEVHTDETLLEVIREARRGDQTYIDLGEKYGVSGSWVGSLVNGRNPRGRRLNAILDALEETDDNL